MRIYNKKNIRYVIYILLYLLYTINIFGAGGENSAAFLKIGVGAEGSALGDAYTVLSEGAVASYWNPANIVQSKKSEIYLYYNSWITDIKQQFISSSFYSQKNKSSISISISYLNSGDIPIYEIVDKSPVYKYSSYSAKDIALSISYSKLFDNISAGISLKTINEKIANYKTNAAAVDAGITYKIPGNKFKISGAILNFGEKIKFDKDGFDLPLTVKFGAAYTGKVFNRDFDIAAEIVKIINEDVDYKTGIQLHLPFDIITRAGYNNSYNIGSNYSFGFGKKFDKIYFNYAWLPSSKVEDAHKFSLNYCW